MKAILHNAQQGNAVFNDFYQKLKPFLVAGHQYVVEVKEKTRSAEQNAKLHATLSDISKQIQWAGKHRDIDTWKRLLTAGWLRARGESVEILPAIDGHGVDVVFRRTSHLTVRECAELLEYVYAWGIENGVRFSAPEYEVTA
ncbi:MAG: recombination protein NinB [Burkholderiales bacterium]|nr:recombination protein NinB [Burkholderiales bacterium]